MSVVEIKPQVYWVGAIDWDVRDFHGYDTPSGSTYNAYLVKDEKTVLFDTVKKGFGPNLIAHISEVVEPEAIDYIVVNHVELDHTGSLPEIVDRVKPEKIICSPNGKKALLAHFHREDWPYEVVTTGSEIGIGSKSIRFVETPMLHWPDSMVSYIPRDKLLISQDGFGQHWATSERFDDEVDSSELMRQSAKYYANILLPYSKLVQKTLGDIHSLGLEIDMIAPDHGLIWRSNPSAILRAWERWSKQETKQKAVVVFDTMWHSTEIMAHAIAEGLMSQGVAVELMNLQVTHRAEVATEMLEAKAMVFGSPTLNNGILPRMADILCYIKGLRPAEKIAAAFGSYGWGGESVKLLNTALEEMKFALADPGLRVQYTPTPDDLVKCKELGRKIGEMVRG